MVDREARCEVLWAENGGSRGLVVYGLVLYGLQRQKNTSAPGLPVALAPPFSPRSPLGCFRRRFPWLPRVLVELKRPISGWVREPRIYLLTLSS